MSADELEQLQRKIAYLMDRQAILDCIASHARGHDRHDSEMITAAYHDDGFDEHGKAINPGPKYAAVDQPGARRRIAEPPAQHHHPHRRDRRRHRPRGELRPGHTAQPRRADRAVHQRPLHRPARKRDGVWRIAVRRSTVEVMISADASGLQHPLFTEQGYSKGTRDQGPVVHPAAPDRHAGAGVLVTGVTDDFAARQTS